MGKEGEAAIMAFDTASRFYRTSRTMRRKSIRRWPSSSPEALPAAWWMPSPSVPHAAEAEFGSSPGDSANQRDQGQGQRRAGTRSAAGPAIRQYPALFSHINRAITTVLARTPVPRTDHVPTAARHMPGGGPTRLKRSVRTRRRQYHSAVCGDLQPSQAIFVSNRRKSSRVTPAA